MRDTFALADARFRAPLLLHPPRHATLFTRVCTHNRARANKRTHAQTCTHTPPPPGDWIGVIYNRVERTIAFTKRGYDLGVAFEGVRDERLYPSVGFRTPDEEVRACACV